jgi:hypothetical protein
MCVFFYELFFVAEKEGVVMDVVKCERKPSPIRIDMAGQRIGMLTVLDFAGRTHAGLAIWKCRCDCGQIEMVSGNNLRGGRTYSCGCTKRPADFKAGNYGVKYLAETLANQKAVP